LVARCAPEVMWGAFLMHTTDGASETGTAPLHEMDHAASDDGEAGSRRGTAEDVRFMSEALALAERGRGLVSPNPVVGAVVVRDGSVVGRGWHGRYGGPHAETVALEDAGDLSIGSTLYVTLEPCCVWGNTPPCTRAIERAGVRKVVFAVEDPNPDVCGSGARTLSAAGIEVWSGVMKREAIAANAGYVSFRTKGLPHVLLKIAMSLDGRVKAPDGGPRWTSSEASRRAVHAMRAASDAVMVGVETVLADDPELTDRREDAPARQPARIVLDGALRTPLESKLVSSAPDVRTIVACGRAADAEREAALAARGVEVWRVERTDEGLDLRSVLRRAASGGLLYVLAEGGPSVASGLMRERLVDRVAFFICPVVYGAGGLAAFADIGPELSLREGFASPRWSLSGGDVVFEADVAGDETAS